MAKNHQTENPLFKALIKRAEAEIATAFVLKLFAESLTSLGLPVDPEVLNNKARSGGK